MTAALQLPHENPGVPNVCWIAIATLIVIVGATLYARNILLADLPSVDDLEAGLHVPSVRITDRHGRLLYEVIGDQDGRHTVVSLDAVPRSCVDATIATEDSSFYRNPGVDARAIIRAVWINLRGGEVLSGGSTITQQVARNTLLTPQERTERTLTRKLRESILAYRIARRYSKDEVLAFYLNQTYYGNLAYGIDAAARAYFGKSVEELGIAECALLAGLPQSPALYDPLTDAVAAADRQDIVLGLMESNDFISAEQVETARREELHYVAERYEIHAPHFVTAVYDQLEDELPPEVLYGGGLIIRTTLDSRLAAHRRACCHLATSNYSTHQNPVIHRTTRTM